MTASPYAAPVAPVAHAPVAVAHSAPVAYAHAAPIAHASLYAGHGLLGAGHLSYALGGVSHHGLGSFHY